MRIFTKLDGPGRAELLSAVCPDCPHHRQLSFLLAWGYIMKELTENEKDTVRQYPLGDILDTVRAPLQRALKSTKQMDFKGPISSLLGALSGHIVAKYLDSRMGQESLGHDLFSIHAKAQKGLFFDDLFHPLSYKVIERETDVEIWNAATELVTKIGTMESLGPLPAFKPPGDQISFRHTSAVQQGFDQKREVLESQLGDETESHTFKSVDGFQRQYFGRKPWSPEALRIWNGAKGRHDGTKWQGLTHPPTQEVMWKWWTDFQDKFLRNTPSVRGLYYTGTIEDSFGDNVKHQVDLISSNRDVANSAHHEWAKISVIGELKQSSHDPKGAYRQMCRYVRDIFTHQPTRRFVHAFTIMGTKMETWVFDRSGSYSGEAFDIQDCPKEFIQVVCGYVMMSDDELGLDTYIKTRPDGRLTISATDTSGQPTTFALTPTPIAFQKAIVSRGTCCFSAEALDHPNTKCVVKFSWVPDKRKSEIELLKLASDRGVKGVAQLVASSEVTSTSELRNGLVFKDSQRPRTEQTSSGKRKSRNPQGGSSRGSKTSRLGRQQAQAGPASSVATPAAVDDPHGQFDNRILRVMVISPAGRPVNQFRGVFELAESLRDAIKGHRSLFHDGRILHRDISDTNIITTNDPETSGFKGMLIDLDIAKENDQPSSGARHRTAAVQFMAIGALTGEYHTYRHDLESFFYVLIWLCIRNGWDLTEASKEQREETMLKAWYSGSYKEMARNKRGDMLQDGLETLLMEFPQEFECIKPLCRKIRGILFTNTFVTSTPQDSNTVYAQLIKAFDEELQAMPLGSSRWMRHRDTGGLKPFNPEIFRPQRKPVGEGLWRRFYERVNFDDP